MKKVKNVIYQYKDGRYLTPSPMGDGDYEIILTKKITFDTPVPKDWVLDEILERCDGFYNELGDPIDIEPSLDDFELLDI